MRRSSILLAALAAVTLASCGGDDGGEDEVVDCAMEDRADTFVVGLARTGGLTFRLMSSTPAPPSRGNNTWDIEIIDGAGAPVTGAAVSVKPFMPDHQHGTGVRAKLTESGAGRYQATPVNLWMPGLWEITVQARPTTGQPDEVVYRFCVSA
jgi:hypothetical protein